MRGDYESSADNDITNTVVSQSPDPEENVINEQK